MEIIVIILIVMIILLTTYLFLIKKELNRVSRSIKDIKNRDSNKFLHSEVPLKELNDVINEVNYLIKDLKNEKIEFERKNRKLKRMMTNISHDLRTPLTSALGYIDILLTSQLSREEQERELKVIEERLKRLGELTNSFFEFSKMVSTGNAPILSEVNIIAVLEESIARYYEDYNNSGREIILDSSIVKFKILSNREMLTRVFDNLISNAFKHSEGNLEIKVENKENLEIIFINELLYSDLDIEHIFDEFYTIDISRTKGNTGLGLAIAKEFIESLGGKIAAKKERNNLYVIISLGSGSR